MPISRKLAEQKVRQIKLDFIASNFAPIIDKCRPEVEQPESKHRAAPIPNLLDRWDEYIEYRTSNIAPTTLINRPTIFVKFVTGGSLYEEARRLSMDGAGCLRSC